ncbi:hypothetical protein D3C80_1773410 [compost metagenome]
MHIAEGDQPGFLAQFRGGVAVVAKQAEVRSPRTLPHHQHGQGFARMLLPGQIAPGVLAYCGKWLGRRTDALADIAERSANHIAGYQHQADLVMVAKQRGEPLVIGQRHHTEQCHRRAASK